jgi:hypothetical protein
VIYLTPHTYLGLFALLTLLLAGTAIGRVAGMRLGEALYITALLLIVIGSVVHRVWLHRKQAASQTEE